MNERHLMFGSIPVTRTTSRPAGPLVQCREGRGPPRDLSHPVGVEPHMWPVDLEVVVVLGVDRGEQLGAPGCQQVGDSAAWRPRRRRSSPRTRPLPRPRSADGQPRARSRDPPYGPWSASGAAEQRRRASRSRRRSASKTPVHLSDRTGNLQSEVLGSSPGSRTSRGGSRVPTGSSLREALRERVVVADGAMGTMLQQHDLDLEAFAGLEGCNEILNVTRPEVVRADSRRLLRGRRATASRPTRSAPTSRTWRSTASSTASTSSPGPVPRIAREVGRPAGPRRTTPGGCSARSARAPSCPRSVTSPSRRSATPTRSRSAACSTAGSTPSWSRRRRTSCRPRPP